MSIYDDVDYDDDLYGSYSDYDYYEYDFKSSPYDLDEDRSAYWDSVNDDAFIPYDVDYDDEPYDSYSDDPYGWY